MDRISKLRDLRGKSGLFRDFSWTLVPIGTKSRNRDLFASTETGLISLVLLSGFFFISRELQISHGIFIEIVAFYTLFMIKCASDFFTFFPAPFGHFHPTFELNLRVDLMCCLKRIFSDAPASLALKIVTHSLTHSLIETRE